MGSRGSNPHAPQLDTFLFLLFLLLVNKKTNSKYFIHSIRDQVSISKSSVYLGVGQWVGSCIWDADVEGSSPFT